LLTYFAVRVADRPPDATHNYGHAKVENLSAFFEAGLLMLTALWIIYEATRRLIFHEGHVDASIWAFLVMLVAIAVDFTRSRALMRVARRLGSQALEADALHFKTDIWSSAVVIGGLLVVRLTQSITLPAWLGQADAIAALGVSAIVILVSLRLVRETIDALLDRAPGALTQDIEAAIKQVDGVSEVRRVRARRAGNKLFADVVIAAPRTYTFEQTHSLTERIERAALLASRHSSPQLEVDVLAHVEPAAAPSETVAEQIYYLAELQGVHAHDIHVREVSGQLEADFDLEVQANMDLQEAHNEATRLEQAIRQSNPLVQRVTTHLEAPDAEIVRRQDVTQSYPDMAKRILSLADEVAGKGSAHDVHIYRPSTGPLNLDNGTCENQEELDLVLHTIFAPHIPLSQVHIQAEEIKRTLRSAYPCLGSVVIHEEPPEAEEIQR
ncbi:MAG TPA: cation-efflux pump, partial [Ktedonobacteraceae bacterium]|nr:cation-efflux pump [Ktedonobacteraceae bacterium]